jgi:hypothetical protein
VPNTLLGVFDVRTRFYREELDLDWRAEHLGGD